VTLGKFRYGRWPNPKTLEQDGGTAKDNINQESKGEPLQSLMKVQE
jgi:hypothetical protein